VNPRIVSERLGHSSVAFTLDTYGHVMPGQQAAAAAAVADMVERATAIGRDHSVTNRGSEAGDQVLDEDESPGQ
jgi:hypothetical protein